MNLPCTMDSSFFSQQMPYCLATFLVYIAQLEYLINTNLIAHIAGAMDDIVIYTVQIRR